jgi:DNA-binding beta-propeller fold protein YncE
MDRQGRIYVADRTNSRIQVFKSDGTFLYQWKSEELGRPWAVSYGPDGYLYVVDGGDADLQGVLIKAYQEPHHINHSHILKLDLSGKILEQWASYGNYDGQLFFGHDIAVGKDGAVYVGDILGRHLQKFARQ